MIRIFIKIASIFIIPNALFLRDVEACSVCFGSSDLLVSKSLNAGVIALVVVVIVVLLSICCTALTWARRAKDLGRSDNI